MGLRTDACRGKEKSCSLLHVTPSAFYSKNCAALIIPLLHSWPTGYESMTPNGVGSTTRAINASNLPEAFHVCYLTSHNTHRVQTTRPTDAGRSRRDVHGARDDLGLL